MTVEHAARELVGGQHRDRFTPWLAFLFLVAPGVDYDIFLSTRARDDARSRPTVEATLLRSVVLAALVARLGQRFWWPVQPGTPGQRST